MRPLGCRVLGVIGVPLTHAHAFSHRRCCWARGGWENEKGQTHHTRRRPSLRQPVCLSQSAHTLSLSPNSSAGKSPRCSPILLLFPPCPHSLPTHDPKKTQNSPILRRRRRHSLASAAPRYFCAPSILSFARVGCRFLLVLAITWSLTLLLLLRLPPPPLLLLPPRYECTMQDSYVCLRVGVGESIMTHHLHIIPLPLLST